MKKLVIVGAGAFAERMYFYMKTYSEYETVAFSVDKEYIPEERSTLAGLPIVPLETLETMYSPNEFDVLIAAGYTNMNNIRKSLFTRCKEKGYHIASFIHPSVIVSPDAELGEGTIFMERGLIQPFCHIGDGNVFMTYTVVSHNNTIGNFNFFSGSVATSGEVTVGDNCYFGRNSFTFDKIKIADYTLVGAGAYVKKDTNAYDVIVPARCVTLENKKSTDLW